MILTGAEVDLFVPSFPELQRVFGLTPFMVELTLGVNLVAHCIAALIAGTLGDKYGRKPVMLAGLLVFIVGSLCCVFAQDYSTLLFGRFLQGVGISGPTVLVYVLILDNYSTEKTQSLLGVVHGVVTIAMAMAPVVGSYVSLFFNWRGNFVVLLILGVITFITTLLFITDKKAKQHHIRISIKEYLPIFNSSKALLYIICLCFAMQSYWVFIAMSPIIFMEGLGVSLQDFGLYQGSVASVFAIGSLTSGYFLKKFGQSKCFIASIYSIAFFFIAILMLMIFNVRDPLIITIVMFFEAAGMVIPINILWPLALDAVSDAKGRMGALLVSSRLIITAITVEAASFFYNGGFFATGMVIALTLMISVVTCYILIKKHSVLKLQQ